MRRIFIGLMAVALVGAGLGYVYRINLMVAGVGLMNRIKNPIGPTEEVVWQQGPTTAPVPSDQRPPNIIVFLTDDLGFNDIQTYGGGVAGGRVPTPNFDRLAAQGVRFNNAYAGNAVCAPSRAMIMTGRYSTRFGFEFTPTPGGMGKIGSLLNSVDGRLRKNIFDYEIMDQMPHFEDMGMVGSEVTVAELLKAQGYYTAHIGKWHLGRSESFRPTAQGFDESLLMASGLYLPENDPNVVNSKQDFDAIDRFLWASMQYAVTFNNSARFKPEGYLTDYFTDNAVKVIDANQNRPFFLYLAHWGVHTPLQASKADYDALSDIQDERLRVYAAMVRSLDRSLGKVLDALEQNGIADNTLIIFTSDNGGAGYIGLPDINRPYRGWKLTLFEGGTHVPMILSWPAAIEGGQVVDAPVSHLDIMPTAVAAGGGTLPADRVIDGMDIRAQLSNPQSRTIFWREGFYQAVMSDNWKMQVSDNPRKVWLYDLSVDPTEQNNLAEARPEVVADLRAKLEAHNADQAEPLWQSFVQMPISIDKTLAEPEAEDDEYIYWPN
ncbi:MAG: sulfatase [Alphaproteobacteria bacterium]|nr:MAG: sulfatase [Alphaproteobacteria bacterium]